LLILLQYFEALNKLLGETDIDTLIYYAEWSIIINFIEYISDDFSKPYNDAVNSLSGIEEKKERYQTCIDITEMLMGFAVGKYFVEKTFNENSKEIVKEMVDNIKQAMYDRIPKMSWLDQSTTNFAIEKLNKMSSDKIGYPDYIFKPKELLKDYEGFEIDSDVFFNTLVNFQIFTLKKYIRKIDEPVDDDKWFLKPQEANAYNHLMSNTIAFPAGILQPPFFNSQQPDYLNYGAMGSTIGHELIHAFDRMGSSYDANGILTNWWTNSTLKEYDNLSMCFIDQYNQYVYTASDGSKYKLNGKLTLNENLADNGGLSRALEAWKLSSKDPKKFNERNKALPNLSNFTADQLFYIAFGQSYCENYTPEIVRKGYEEQNVHSPGRYRIIGSVSNSEHFAKIFNCPKNSPMNPEKKCSVW